MVSLTKCSEIFVLFVADDVNNLFCEFRSSQIYNNNGGIKRNFLKFRRLFVQARMQTTYPHRLSRLHITVNGDFDLGSPF